MDFLFLLCSPVPTWHCCTTASSHSFLSTATQFWPVTCPIRDEYSDHVTNQRVLIGR